VKHSDRGLSVFLCHGSEDKDSVRKLREKLQVHGFEPWLDEAEILPGQDWDVEIRRAVRASDTVVVCLSTTSVGKSGYLQKEIRFALDVADEKPDGTIFLIPARLEPCEVPDRLRRWQWVDLYSDEGFQRLLASLRARAGIGTGKDERPDTRAAPTSDLVALRAEAANALKPSLRQVAIRRIAIRYGLAELPWLQNFAYSAKYWASRREAVNQIVRLDPPDLVAWLIEMAETHPAENNRRLAMDYVAEREGGKCFSWLLYRVSEESSFWNRYRASQLLSSMPRAAMQEDSVLRAQDLTVLKRAASAESHPDLRVNLVTALLNVAASEPSIRPWFEKMLGQEQRTFYRAALLGSALQVWADAGLRSQLEELANQEHTGNDEYEVGRNFARTILRSLDRDSAVSSS
jgi:hypothetical protein